MSCYHPRKIFYTGRKTETGAKEGILTSGFLDALSFEQAEKKIKGLKLGDCSGIQWMNGRPFLTLSEDIPCGYCLGCKQDYSKDWATRCYLEAKKYGQNNAFLTLTYDDQHLPESQEENKRIMQKFLKRLRKRYGAGIRVAYCGEYGSHTGRIHAHALIMNISITDKKAWNQTLTYSPEINRIWGNGNVLIGNVTYESAAYVARYVLKKANGPKDEFFITSRKPGLGFDYYTKKGEIFGNGGIYVYTDKGKRLSIPKYFKRKLAQEDPETAEYLKARAKKMAEGRDIQMVHAYEGWGNVEKILNRKEEMAKHKQSRMKRPLND